MQTALVFLWATVQNTYICKTPLFYRRLRLFLEFLDILLKEKPTNFLKCRFLLDFKVFLFVGDEGFEPPTLWV